jgi:branched-chain amino acid transport system substrate-binding protein
MSASPTYITTNHFTRKSSFDPLLHALKTTLSLLSIIVLASLSAMADSSTQRQYRIAAILPLTGDSGPVGLACRNGIEFALESLPPEIRAKYEVVYEDDGLQPRQSIAAFQKLLQGGKIDLLINFSSNTSKVLAPMAERNKIPFLAVAADMSVGMKKTYTFNFFDSPDQFGLIAVDAAQRRGISKFARATTIQDGALAYKEAFDRVAKGQPKAILDQEFQPDIRDFRAFLTKVRSKPEIDAFFLLLLPGQSGIFAKQARELGLHHPFFSIELFSVREEITASGGALIGSWFADVAEPQEFLDRYRARFENAPTFGATYGHDAMLLANAGLTKGIELQHFFAEVKDFKGAMGSISSYSENGVRAFRFPIVIKEVTEEGFRRLDG